MKQWIVAGVMVGLIALVLWYVLGSHKTENILVDCPYPPFERATVQPANWNKWWPEPKVDSHFTIGGRPIAIDKVLLNGFDARMVDDTSIQFSYRFVAAPNAQTAIGITLNTNASVWDRITSGRAVRNDAEEWLEAVQQHFENDSAVYGMAIQKTMVKDPALISVRQVFDTVPSMADIYGLVNELRAYIKAQGAEATNHPMVNMYNEGRQTVVMTALATSEPLPPTERYFPKRMELGYILEGQVTGGMERVKEAERQIAFYASDYARNSPAIPYQLWITDRMAQPDSNQWVTGLYFPIMY